MTASLPERGPSEGVRRDGAGLSVPERPGP